MALRAGTPARFRSRPASRGVRRGRLPETAWRLLNGIAIGAWAGLALFHVWLFWGQWQDGRLSDPIIAAKWTGSALLLGALAMLHRSGRALLFGRQALVVWTLVALVHVGAGQHASHSSPASTPGILFVIPTLGAALTAGMALWAAARRTRSRRHHVRPLVPANRRPLLFTPLVPASAHGLRAPPIAIA
jgi:hypothetical protein